MDSANLESKIFGENKKFEIANTESASLRQLFTDNLHCIYNYLHSIYIVLGIINLERIWSIQEDVWVGCMPT